MHSRHRCTAAGRVTAHLLLSFLAFSPSRATTPGDQLPLIAETPLHTSSAKIPPSGDHDFSLRHIFHHGVYEHPKLHRRFDIPETVPAIWIESEEELGAVQESYATLKARSSPVKIERLRDRRPSTVDPLVAAARQYDTVWTWMSPSAWTIESVSGPNITDKDTVITLAQMAANAYVPEPETGEWKDVNGGFNRTDDYGFGWDGDGLRGYIYADATQSTIVIGLKGTSLAVYDGEGTTTQDKENDNLYFSCCCGQQGSALYRKVCDCASGTYTCNTTCLKKKLLEENRYYMAARHLYSNVTALYPNSHVWMSGHSLGGSLSAMLGLTYGIPVVTFEAVPDALPARRLGLPSPPGSDPSSPQKREYTGAFHFGNTADPVYLGICNGATASCSYAGYALESACHTGMECVYDVVGDWGWGVHIWSHRIVGVIENIIKKYDHVPQCKFTPECQDCPLWKEVTGNSTGPSTTTTTTTTTRAPKRTSTCKTPGWWGCLDETTTSGIATSTSPVTTSTTYSCKTPGWFGCKDKTDVESTTTTRASRVPPTVTATQTSSATETTSHCHSRGYFGCIEPTSPSSTAHLTTTIPTTTTYATTASTTITSCATPGFFWGCWDEPSSTRGSVIRTPSASELPHPRPTTAPPSSGRGKGRCLKRSWFGWCRKREL